MRIFKYAGARHRAPLRRAPQVRHGSLYPALRRLEDRGWVASFGGTSENNRKARYYRLT